MFENMRVSLRKIGFSYLVVELLNKFLQLEDKHDDLYTLTKELLHVVDAGDYANIENVESFFKLKLLTLTGFDMTNDQAYLRQRKTGAEIKSLIENIEGSDSAGSLDMEYSKIREINKLIDSYIIFVLGEDIFSTKFLESMKNEK